MNDPAMQASPGDCFLGPSYIWMGSVRLSTSTRKCFRSTMGRRDQTHIEFYSGSGSGLHCWAISTGNPFLSVLFPFLFFVFLFLFAYFFLAFFFRSAFSLPLPPHLLLYTTLYLNFAVPLPPPPLKGQSLLRSDAWSSNPSISSSLPIIIITRYPNSSFKIIVRVVFTVFQ